MSYRVYVIDDDDQFRNSLCALIESIGLQVDRWATPEDLLEKRASGGSATFLDYRLPLFGPRGPEHHRGRQVRSPPS